MPEWMNAPWAREVWQLTYQRLPTLGAALGILVGGWLAAYVVQKMVHAGLRRTTIDDVVARLLGFETGGDHGDRVERTVAKAIYYVLVTFVLVAFFSYLQIEAVTQPLVSVLNELGSAVPNLLKAFALGFGGFLLAKGIRRLLLAVLERVGFERRIHALTGEEPPASEEKKGTKKKDKRTEQPISTLLADIAYWFILVVVAIPVFEALQISVLAGPMASALGTITTYLPKIGGAVVLLVVGYVVSRMVRAIVAGVLDRVGVDRALVRVGLGSVTKDQPLSQILGTLAMVFVLLQFAISAVGRLELEEISVPLRRMLESIYGYLPKLLVGALLVAVGVFVGRLAGNLASRLLAALGFNSLIAHVGLYKIDATAKEQEDESKRLVTDRIHEMEEGSATRAPVEGEDALLASRGSRGVKTPSDVGGVVVGTLVVLLFLRQALDTMDLNGLQGLLDELLAFVPHAFVALVVLGAGLWGGRWVHQRVDELTRGSNDRVLGHLGSLGHFAVVAFAAMVALQQVGVGRQLIAIAFGSILGAVCLAAALAFGLGGREVAGRILAKEYDRRAKGSADK